VQLRNGELPKDRDENAAACGRPLFPKTGTLFFGVLFSAAPPVCGGMGTALIAGASGLVGGELLEQLLAAKEYDRVVAIGRRPLDRAHPKLVPVVADFAALEQTGADLRCTDAFCCLGTTLKAAGSREAFAEAFTALAREG